MLDGRPQLTHLGQTVFSCRRLLTRSRSHTLPHTTCPPLCVQLHQVKVLTAQAAQAETAAEGLRLVQQGTAPPGAPASPPAAAGQAEAGDGEASLLARLAAAETDQERLLLLAEVRWSLTETLCCQAGSQKVGHSTESVPALGHCLC